MLKKTFYSRQLFWRKHRGCQCENPAKSSEQSVWWESFPCNPLSEVFWWVQISWSHVLGQGMRLNLFCLTDLSTSDVLLTVIGILILPIRYVTAATFRCPHFVTSLPLAIGPELIQTYWLPTHESFRCFSPVKAWLKLYSFADYIGQTGGNCQIILSLFMVSLFHVTCVMKRYWSSSHLTCVVNLMFLVLGL